MTNQMQPKPAEFMLRASALLFDVSFQYICAYFVIPIFLSLVFPESEIRGLFIGIGLITTIFFYEPILVSTRGQTFGHQFFKIRVTNTEGERMNFFLAVARFWVKWFLGLYSFFTMFGQQRRAIHDHVTNSIVVKITSSGASNG